MKWDERVYFDRVFPSPYAAAEKGPEGWSADRAPDGWDWDSPPSPNELLVRGRKGRRGGGSKDSSTTKKTKGTTAVWITSPPGDSDWRSIPAAGTVSK